MNKLRALTAYLIERRLVPAEQLDSFAEQVSLALVWKPEERGLRLGDMRYRAVVILERLADHPARLMALVGSWLENNDQDRDGLPDPVFDVEQMDRDLADVELAVEFIEPVHLAEDPAGEIEAFGQRWAFVPFDLWIAEHGEVRHG
ncbi:phage tail protein [Pseudomonas aeruginosa]|uniref:P2 phage tail completion R family protein n=1 Tax=Pseudomonas paraeruginosa TaxID=2994495 RepID=A0A2R3J2Z6_9PSED|nr:MULTISPECIES: phage tail protein [Pseudomonas aeruginosa group]AVK08539.1 P2 phage tail completion R family protein [Pseudomonas paraeruginosa]KSD65745.1 phage tail protein [Pseudomonas aeruginosa]MCT9630669.1 phage tail protein [Pseudomonas aeruginosa]MCW8031860.1 phage tail protein [Pseudomonas aeruginosa]HBO8870237.1 phage tail protein [Pseudomonas aeruginosa]